MAVLLMNNENTNGGYDAEGVIWHQHSNKLLVKILEYFSKDVPVMDIGCGHNFYVTVLNYLKYQAIGFDMVDLGSYYFRKQDVTKPLPKLDIKTNVISLEVGEHIPSELAEGYLNNVAGQGGDVIMSWATPGQLGIGHINCQSNEWVISEMKKRGYLLDSILTDQLRKAVKDCHCSWFVNTLMYFVPCA